MEFELPETFKTRLGDDGDADAVEEEADTDLANFLSGIEFEDDDIPVDARQFALNPDEIDDEPSNHATLEELEREIAINLPAISKKESTFQTCKRLTEQQPWVPFEKPNKSLNELQEAEYQFFKQEESKYLRHGAYLHAKRGYGTFAEAWDMEVATRFKEKASGNDEVVLIYRKSVKQLQDHCDNVQKHMNQANLLRPKDDNRDYMEHVLRQTRRNRGETQQAHQSQPPTRTGNNHGRPAFGNPTPLNTGIAARAFQCNTDATTAAVSPFALRPITPNNPSRILLGGNFNRNKYCWRCGFSKKTHSEYSVPFGHLCVNNCLRQDCAKCGERSEFHHGGMTAVGPSCLKAPAFNSMCHDWCGKNNSATAGI